MGWMKKVCGVAEERQWGGVDKERGWDEVVEERGCLGRLKKEGGVW